MSKKYSTKFLLITKFVVAFAIALIALFVIPGFSARAASKTPKLKSSQLTINVGSKKKIKIKNLPDSLISIKYTSSDKSVAKVSKKGYVTGKAVGSAEITVKIKYNKSGEKQTTECTEKITVVEAKQSQDKDDPQNSNDTKEKKNIFKETEGFPDVEVGTIYSVEYSEEGSNYYKNYYRISNDPVADLELSVLRQTGSLFVVTVNSYRGEPRSVIIPDEIEFTVDDWTYYVLIVGIGGFSDCDSLTDITLSGRVTDVKKGAFKNCKNLHAVSWNDWNENLGWGEYFDNFIDALSIKDLAFGGCAKLKNVQLPFNTLYISENAFQGCSELILNVGKKTIQNPEERKCLWINDPWDDYLDKIITSDMNRVEKIKAVHDWIIMGSYKKNDVDFYLSAILELSREPIFQLLMSILEIPIYVNSVEDSDGYYSDFTYVQLDDGYYYLVDTNLDGNGELSFDYFLRAPQYVDVPLSEEDLPDDVMIAQYDYFFDETYNPLFKRYLFYNPYYEEDETEEQLSQRTIEVSIELGIFVTEEGVVSRRLYVDGSVEETITNDNRRINKTIDKDGNVTRIEETEEYEEEKKYHKNIDFDKDGNVTWIEEIEYDENGIKYYKTIDSDGFVTISETLDNGWVKETKSNGYVTEQGYDESGKYVVRINYPDDSPTKMSEYVDGKLTKKVSASGIITEYDSDGVTVLRMINEQGEVITDNTK